VTMTRRGHEVVFSDNAKIFRICKSHKKNVLSSSSVFVLLSLLEFMLQAKLNLELKYFRSKYGFFRGFLRYFVDFRV